MLRGMAGEEIIQALAAASRARDPLLADVLATEALNRIRRVRTAILHLGEGLCLVDAEGHITLFNPAAERMTGWRRAEVEGRHVEGTLLLFPCWRSSLVSARTLHLVEEPFLRKGGGTFLASCTMAPVVAEAGTGGVVLVFRDVTEERALEKQMEAFYQAHDLLGEGLVLLKDQRIAHANAAFCRMSGYGRDELRALRDIVLAVAPEARPEMAERMLRCREQTAREERVRTRLLRKDGRVVPVEVAAVTVRGDEPAEVVCIVRETADERCAPRPWPDERAG